jgi:hypothetical protein
MILTYMNLARGERLQVYPCIVGKGFLLFDRLVRHEGKSY